MTCLGKNILWHVRLKKRSIYIIYKETTEKCSSEFWMFILMKLYKFSQTSSVFINLMPKKEK